MAAKKVTSLRLDPELLAWAKEYGARRGVSQATVIERAIQEFRLLTRSGVPDMAVVAVGAAKPRLAMVRTSAEAKAKVRPLPPRPPAPPSRPSR